MKKILTQEIVRNFLDYDPSTGWFTWKNISRKDLIGKRAGHPHDTGYRIVKVSQERILEHRLVWFWNYGNLLENMVIDHIDGDKHNNKLENLREVSRTVNGRNRKEIRDDYGLNYSKTDNAWRVRIYGYHVGYFKNKEDAIIARDQKLNEWKDNPPPSGRRNRNAHPPLTQEYLKEKFDYRDYGLYWKDGKNAGKRVGYTDNSGYRILDLNKPYKEHRIIWFWNYGEMPPRGKVLDHINGIRDDNRLENLRLCTQAENVQSYMDKRK